MDRSGKKKQQQGGQDAHRERRSTESTRSAKDKASPKGRRPRTKNPIRRFVVIVAVAMLLFNIFFYVGVSEESLFGSYLNLNARVSAAFINTFGEQATVTGTVISSPRFSLAVAPGCDGIQASVFFTIAVLAAPVLVSWPRRIRAAVLGTLLLLLMNVVRLITLYYAGIHFPSAFDILHEDVWQGAFILLPIVLWVAWVVTAVRKGAFAREAAK